MIGGSNGAVRNEWIEVNGNRNRIQSGRRKEIAGRNKTHLVVTRVKLGTLGLQVRQYLANKDVEICDVDLLTKREDASFLTFKITVKNEDVEKLKDPSVWPKEWTIREFKEKVTSPEKRTTLKTAGGMKQTTTAQANEVNTGMNYGNVSHVNNSVGIPGWYSYADIASPGAAHPTIHQTTGNPINMMNYRNSNTGYANMGSLQPGTHFVPMTTMHQGNAPLGNWQNGISPVRTHAPPVPKQRSTVTPVIDTLSQQVGGNLPNGQGSPVRIPWSQVMLQDSPNVFGVDQFSQH